MTVRWMVFMDGDPFLRDSSDAPTELHMFRDINGAKSYCQRMFPDYTPRIVDRTAGDVLHNENVEIATVFVKG